MTATTQAPFEMPLRARMRATKLPPPGERRAIRERARLSREDIARELRSRGLNVTAAAIVWWEKDKATGGCDPRFAKAIAYREVLDQIQREVQSWGVRDAEAKS